MEKKKQRKRSKGDIGFDIFVAIVMIIMVLICIYPFYLAVIMSFNEGLDAQRGGIYLLPRIFTLENYAKLFRDGQWGQAFAVTLARTVLGTFMTVFFTLIVSYGLSFQELVFRKVYYSIFYFCHVFFRWSHSILHSASYPASVKYVLGVRGTGMPEPVLPDCRGIVLPGYSKRTT